MTYRSFAFRQIHLCAFACGWAAVLAIMVASPARAEEPANFALGRHLAQECNACHRGSGTAIPPIAGRRETELFALLKAYAAGTLPNGLPANMAMVSVAQSLDEMQMAAVAGYFATLPPAKPTR